MILVDTSVWIDHLRNGNNVVKTLLYNSEVLKLVESKKLFGAGIGWIDAHLIASALLTKIEMITLDKSLAKAAASLGIRSI